MNLLCIQNNDKIDYRFRNMSVGFCVRTRVQRIRIPIAIKFRCILVVSPTTAQQRVQFRLTPLHFSKFTCLLEEICTNLPKQCSGVCTVANRYCTRMATTAQPFCFWTKAKFSKLALSDFPFSIILLPVAYLDKVGTHINPI